MLTMLLDRVSDPIQFPPGNPTFVRMELAQGQGRVARAWGAFEARAACLAFGAPSSELAAVPWVHAWIPQGDKQGGRSTV